VSNHQLLSDPGKPDIILKQMMENTEIIKTQFSIFGALSLILPESVTSLNI
jgi:hypothetical protein